MSKLKGLEGIRERACSERNIEDWAKRNIGKAEEWAKKKREKEETGEERTRNVRFSKK